MDQRIGDWLSGPDLSDTDCLTGLAAIGVGRNLAPAIMMGATCSRSANRKESDSGAGRGGGLFEL